MERRHLLKLAIGLAAAAITLNATAHAAPLFPHPLTESNASQDPQRALITAEEVQRLEPQEIRWGHGHHWGWHHRHWGWHHRHWGWRHRHWGWHHRWHRHHWRHW
jgi:hypothetical protein